MVELRLGFAAACHRKKYTDILVPISELPRLAIQSIQK